MQPRQVHARFSEFTSDLKELYVIAILLRSVTRRSRRRGHDDDLTVVRNVSDFVVPFLFFPLSSNDYTFCL